MTRLRIRVLNDVIAFHRTSWNYSLDRAVEWCRDLKKPLVILEALRTGYRWASDRIHRFVIDGMADNAGQRLPSSVLYYPYVEPKAGAGAGLLETLAAKACVVVTDDFPCFFLPRMIAATAPRLSVRMEAIDGNGLLPLRAADHAFTRAFDFRRFLQKHLKPHLAEDQFPQDDPLRNLRLPGAVKLPPAVLKRWPRADLPALTAGPEGLAALPIDHRVSIAPVRGGSVAAGQRLDAFLESRLPRYGERNKPEADSASGLSPYLHVGHLSAHEVFAAATKRENWTPEKTSDRASGQNTGWWGTSAALESFFDELITWREVGYNFCSQRDDYDQYESLPTWAQQTLAKHAGDRRDHVYSLAQFEQAATHDPLWNAAQRQLLTEGRIHNYLRMLWGKKIVEWTARPQDALDIMIELNNKFALDGRNPNSYTGILWVLGRYDRPWAPERPIFGTVRWMSSENTARKMNVKGYLEKYGPQRPLF